MARRENDDERAIALYQEAFRVARDHDDVLWMGDPLCNLGFIALDWGDHEQAAHYFREALNVDHSGRRVRSVLRGVQGLAQALLAGGQAEASMRLLGAVPALRTEVDEAVTSEDQSEYDATVALARSQLPGELADAARGPGQQMVVREVIAEAVSGPD